MAGIPFNAATAAYGNAQKLISQAARPQTDMLALGGQSGQGADFGKLLAETVQSVVNTGNTSEQMSMNMVNGKADMVD
ncbi:MAG: flagellar hook-basal body protein FliE, partial [Devosia sp.]